MRIVKGTVLVLVAASLAGCVSKQNKTVDRFVDSKDLSQLQAGIWIDPHGCDHWIIDDGFEGYLSQRLDKYGKPVCSGAAPANTAIGKFKSGSPVADQI
ncbi:hypothetical protein BV394_12515 [Brevirhabdus pacifica]|uniref:Uncharacterized protein n=1 Tax=Brevirhabdus pacifica TaxID=1267768 RepID=A0A1U7DKD6_9RHOB|nr:hypothetical protein [Brevirhabdus pacifica]APX90450.1 hypothetical protein BV394_12515 [Brevirhabdus pacifica]OWU78532.1 lipoprotein [Loktanella sp. 22II-4b]PJJ85451.1 hypothetical protein CLV77_2321 [Brevirhabdus pacifica]